MTGSKLKGRKRPPRSVDWCKKISLGRIGIPAWNKGKVDLEKLRLFRIRKWFSKLPMRKIQRKKPVYSLELIQKKINVCKNRIWSEESLKKISDSKIGKPRPEHVIQAMIKASTGRIPTVETRKKMSIANSGRKWTESRKDEFRNIRKNWVIPIKDTKPEKMMQIALSLNNIKFEKQKMFKLGKRWHAVDLFIEPNICVEVDGITWHIPIDRIKRDLFQSQELTIMGYHVIRIRDKDILKDANKPAENVIRLIKEITHNFLANR